MLNFLLQLVFVLLIVFVNLWVSFTLALAIALRARGTRISRFRLLLKSLWEQAKQQPLNLFFPVNAIKQTMAEEGVKAETKADKAMVQDK